jgi:hypothetical protein
MSDSPVISIEFTIPKEKYDYQFIGATEINGIFYWNYKFGIVKENVHVDNDDPISKACLSFGNDLSNIDFSTVEIYK